MLALAAKRCEGHDNVSFHEGDVTALPVADADFDRALSVQVLEYVEDIPAALGGAARACCGRAGACCSGTSTGPRSPGTPTTRPRMERFLRAWDEHLTDPVAAAHARPPSCAPPASRTSRWQGHAFATDDVTSTSYAGALLPLMARLRGHGRGAGVGRRSSATLQARGESYFACIQFCFTGTRPR